jgi:Leucine-rich repeat (LRR) protein
MFNDIESVFKWSNFNSIEYYIYDQQYPLFVQTELWTESNESFTISNLNYLPGDSDTYRWEKNNVPIPGATGKELVILNPQLSDEGTYICWISNSFATGYEIKTSIIYLKVNDVHGAGVPLSEYLALKKFYDTNNGENWFRQENWLDTITCTVGDWHGIQVKNNHVQWIALDSCNITGALPKELTDLKHLEEIHFHANNISGSIPTWINKLSKLSHIYLSKNNLTGAIPSEIGQLPNLKILELDENQLEGAIPLELKNNTNLNFLSLSNNKLTGSIPAELANLGGLWSLNLEHNLLSGTVPASFGDLVNLSVLDLSHNQLVGPLPVELKKLKNISRFDIDNNLIGQIDLNKSSLLTQNVQTDSNRQIPDEMADLLEMDTLYLGGNKLQFNDIEAIFSWNNFNDFKDFIYFPQDSIGVNKTESAFTSDSITFSIQNYYPGLSDKCQWYKNNLLIQGATNSTFKISKLQLSDAGKYYCQVTNPVAKELTLRSKQITLQVTNNFKGAGVPVSEFLALAKFYRSNEGENWNNSENWLDTISHSVKDWDRIVVENGNVNALNLSGLNLSGNVAAIISDFDSLNWLNLANNNFTFSDLEALETELNSLDEFIYSPQAMIGSKMDTTIYKYESITLEFPKYVQGNNDFYSWHKNGAILENTNKPSFIIENAALTDSGFYSLSISNPLFPDLIFESDTIALKVLIPVKTNDIPLTDFKIYPNPASDKIFIDLQNQTADLKIFNIAGITVFEGKGFATSWLDLTDYLPGVYVFRFEIANTGVVNRKVIIE